LWYQPGLRVPPKFDAMTINAEPSRIPTSGTVRLMPVRAPLVVSMTTGSPATHEENVSPPVL
jgi:hypothetical protein